MSDLQERTARLIAEAQALLAKARKDVAVAKERLVDAGCTDREAYRAQVEKKLGAKGPRMMDEMVRVYRKSLQEQVAQHAPPPDNSAPTPFKRRRLGRMV